MIEIDLNNYSKNNQRWLEKDEKGFIIFFSVSQGEKSFTRFLNTNVKLDYTIKR